MTLEELYQLIVSRKESTQKSSYVVSLFEKDTDRIVQKVGEEAVEVIIAAKNPDKSELVSETSDLLFHLLILLAAKNISLSDIEDELEKRKK